MTDKIERDALLRVNLDFINHLVTYDYLKEVTQRIANQSNSEHAAESNFRRSKVSRTERTDAAYSQEQDFEGWLNELFHCLRALDVNDPPEDLLDWLFLEKLYILDRSVPDVAEMIRSILSGQVESSSSTYSD